VGNKLTAGFADVIVHKKIQNVCHLRRFYVF